MPRRSRWAILRMTYVVGEVPASKAKKAPPRVDYREILRDAEFAVFPKLRALCKALAERDGVPPHAVFTNEQLAAIVQQDPGQYGPCESVERWSGLGREVREGRPRCCAGIGRGGGVSTAGLARAAAVPRRTAVDLEQDGRFDRHCRRAATARAHLFPCLLGTPGKSIVLAFSTRQRGFAARSVGAFLDRGLLSDHPLEGPPIP